MVSVRLPKKIRGLTPEQAERAFAELGVPLGEVSEEALAPFRDLNLREMIGENLATQKQLQLLKKYIEQGTLQEKLITRPIWLSFNQATELGFDVEEGEFIKLGPEGVDIVETGTPITISLATPEGISEPVPVSEALRVLEVAEVDLLERVYPDLSQEEIDRMFAEMEISDAMPPTERFRAEQAQAAFLSDIISKGRTEDTEALLKRLGLADEDIETLFAAEEVVFQDIPPQGLSYTVEDEQGRPLELRIVEDFEYVGRERVKRSEDLIVYHEDREVGRVNYETGEFTPTEISFWQKLGAGALSVLEKIFIPASFVGAGIGYLGEELNRRAAMTEEEWEAYQAAGLPVASISDFQKFLPGGEYYERLQASPFWVRLGLELPFWVGLAQGGTSALRAIKALDRAAAEGVIPKAMATTGRVVLEATTFPTQERVLGFIVGRTVSATYRTAMSASLRRNLRSWAATTGKEIPKETEDAFVRAALAELSPRFLTRQAIKTLFKPTKAGFTLTEAGAREAEAAAGAAVRNYVRLLPAAERVPARVAPKAVVITTDMTTRLAALGHTEAAIAKMTPEEAQAILAEVPAVPEVPPVEPVVEPEVTGLKIGDEARIMGVDSVLAKTEIIGGVRYELFSGAKLREGRAAIRITDVDTGSVVTLKQHPTFDIAEVEFNDVVSKAKVTEAPPAVAVVDVGVLPENPTEVGAEIAEQLGVTYSGIQEGIADIPSVMLFTDPQTGSTFAANTAQIARTKLDAMRAKFAEAEGIPAIEVEAAPTPIVEPVVKPEAIVPNTPDAILTLSEFDNTFKIATPEGAQVVGNVKNVDFGDKPASPQRGELFMTEVPEALQRKGLGTSLAIDALRLMQQNGVTTVKMFATTESGKASLARLIADGHISEAIATTEAGATEHTITLKPAPKPPAVEAPPVKPPTVEEAVQKELVIQKTKQDTFVETTEQTDISKAGDDALNAQSEVAGLPPPNIPPGLTGHIGSGGNNAENSLYDMTNRVIPGEDAGRAALRLWDGTRNRMATETIAWWRKGNKTLKDLGIGRTEGRNQRLTEEDSLELFKALHGEGDVPGNLQSVYDDLKTLLDQEASDMLAFDPTFSRVLMAHPDYFPRGWRPPTEATRLKLGAKPGFLKPRVDATFTEMIEAGWEPISWNPYDMAALRRMAGTEYREGQILITRLKTFSKAIAEHDAPREGWRVPKVGPAFEGKPYVGGDGKAYMTPKVSVPNRVADVLESIYGVKVEFRVAGVDIWKAISGFGQVTKRAKLFMSLFQHVDFLTRDFMVGFTPEGIRHGLPLKFPALAARVTWSAVSPISRANLEARILSGEPLYIDSDITLKMVADKGWKLGQDELLIRRDVREQLEAIVKDAQAEGLKVRWFQRAGQGIVKATDPVTRRLNTVARFFEAGLFDGVYRESQAYVLEHVLIPRLRRLHPEWTSEQIAGSAAEEINKQFSTLAVWQSVLQQPAAREAARTFFFSWNESESWIRQATSAVKGENARYWREYTIAMFISLALAANVINMISEGEPLPPDRYVPLKLGSPYSSMPWGIAYNDKFFSPRLPWNGRNGQPLYLDIVGQADTWLRWILDPAGALTARVNVLPRAVLNQAQGEDFWGRELKDWDDRVKQAVLDLLAPIGAGNLLEIARLQWPEVAEALPEAEGRIGIVGSLIQATGLNVRSIKTRDMLDKFARESGLKKADGTPVKTWADLEPSQRRQLEKNETLQRELGLRSVTGVERQYPGAEGFAKLDEVDQERITRGEGLVAELVADLVGADRTEGFDLARTFRMEVSRLKKEIADRKAQIDEDFQLFKDTGELPEDPNKRALVEYYNIFEKAKRPSGVMDWDKVHDLELALRGSWTPAQEAYVDRNIGLTEWGPLMQEFIDAQRLLGDSGYWDVAEIDRRVFRFEHPEIEDTLTGKFYNYKPIEEEAEKIALRWQDVYRQIEAMRETYKEMSDIELNKLPRLEGISAEDWAKMSPARKRDALIDFEKERIYNENPGFWEDDRRKIAWNAVGDALDEKRSLVFVNEFVEYSNISREFSPNSSQAKLYRFDSKELNALGIQDETFDWDELDESKVTIWRIDVKYEVEDTEYDALDGDDTEGRNAYLAGEGLEGDALARRVQYRKDRRRRAMLKLDAPDILVEEFVDYGEIIDQSGANSAEAKLFKTEHPDLQEFGEAEETFGWDDLSDIDIRVVNIDVKWATEDEEYDAIPGDDRQARDAYLAEHEAYRKDRRRREAYKATGPKDETFSPEQVETYVSYYELPEKGFRRERILLEDKGFGEAMHMILGIDIPERVPPVQYDEIYEQWQADFDKLDGLSDHRSADYIEDPEERDKAREAMRFEAGTLTEFGKAEIRRNGYGTFVPEKQIDNYVGYYSLLAEGKPDDWENRAGTALPWYEDDWWMMEHPEFYREVYRRILGNERKDYRLVPPTRKLGAKYLTYLRIVFNQAARDQYRLDNPDLDEWGVSVGIWTKTMSERRRRAELTPTEIFEEEIAEREQETEEALEEIEEGREALVP